MVSLAHNLGPSHGFKLAEMTQYISQSLPVEIAPAPGTANVKMAERPDWSFFHDGCRRATGYLNVAEFT